MRRALPTIAAAIVLGVVVAVAPAAPAGTATTLKVTTKAGLTYNVKVLKAKAGKVTIRYTNSSGITHDVRIRKGSRKLGGTKVISKGTTSTTLTLKKGTYTFYCSIPGHEQAGMKGTLRVS
jgi:plastocyanin